MSLPSPSVDDWRSVSAIQELEDVTGEEQHGAKEARSWLPARIQSISETGDINEHAGAKAAESTFDGPDTKETPVVGLFPDTLNRRVRLSADDSKRICRKADKTILVLMIWIYFTQALNKTVLDYNAIGGFQADIHLVGDQASLLSMMVPIAQMAWQPLSFILLVKVPPRILVPIMMMGMGIAQVCAAAARSFGALTADRLMLGMFDAGMLPLFALMTCSWYRRREQPLRIAAWYGATGLATMVAAALSYAFSQSTWTISSCMWRPFVAVVPLSRILSSADRLYKGKCLINIVSLPWVYLKLDNEPATAHFLTDTEQYVAVERLRADQAGADTHDMRWGQVVEVFLDAKSYLFFIISLGNNIGAQASITLWPFVLKDMGVSVFTATLLNIPFGAFQYLIVLLVAWAVARLRWKSLTIGSMLLPIIIGLLVLWLVPRTPGYTGVLLIGYYLLAFTFGCNTLIVAWILANTAGQTKRSVMMSVYTVASSLGSIIGPVFFSEQNAPRYQSGLKVVLGVYIAIFWAILMQTVNLVMLNRLQEKKRVSHGKPLKIHDNSMDRDYAEMDSNDDFCLGTFAFADITDRENDEFIYLY